MSHLLNTGQSFASLWCNQATGKAFRLLFEKFFNIIEKLTNKPLHFKAFHPDSTWLVILFDSELTQLQGFGDTLVQFNKPAISGIQSNDPYQLLTYVTYTCTVHFDR